MGLDRWHRTRVYGVAFATLFIGNSLQCKNEASVIPPVNQPVSRAAKAEIKAITNQKKSFSDLDNWSQIDLFESMDSKQILQTIENNNLKFTSDTNWMLVKAALNGLQPDDIRHLLKNGYLTIDDNTHRIIKTMAINNTVLDSDELRDLIKEGKIYVPFGSTNKGHDYDIDIGMEMELNPEDIDALNKAGVIETNDVNSKTFNTPRDPITAKELNEMIWGTYSETEPPPSLFGVSFN